MPLADPAVCSSVAFDPQYLVTYVAVTIIALGGFYLMARCG